MSKYDQDRLDNKINNFFPYHKKWLNGMPNPFHAGISELVIQLKDKDKHAIQCLAAEILNKLPNFDVICSMPSSNAAETNNGIRMAAQLIATHLGIVDGTGCLFRKITRSKSSGGNRDNLSQFDSLEVRQEHLLTGKKILLLDDVTTSGGSLVVGAEMLEQAGAKTVLKYALAATKYYGATYG
jgi:predicted amidophosphoribosyltransferase